MSSDKVRDVMLSRDLYAAFVGNMVRYADERGLPSPNALAVAANVSANTIRGWARLSPGKAKEWADLKPGGKSCYPRLDVLEAVADTLGCEVWEMFHPDIDSLHRKLAKLRRIEEASGNDDVGGTPTKK